MPYKEAFEALDVVVQEVLDAAIERHHDRTAGETFEECLVCHEWDWHHAWCWLPVLKAWLSKGRDAGTGMLSEPSPPVFFEHAMKECNAAHKALDDAGVSKVTMQQRRTEMGTQPVTMSLVGRVREVLRDRTDLINVTSEYLAADHDNAIVYERVLNIIKRIEARKQGGA